LKTDPCKSFEYSDFTSEPVLDTIPSRFQRIQYCFLHEELNMKENTLVI